MFVSDDMLNIYEITIKKDKLYDPYSLKYLSTEGLPNSGSHRALKSQGQPCMRDKEKVFRLHKTL